MRFSFVRSNEKRSLVNNKNELRPPFLSSTLYGVCIIEWPSAKPLFRKPPSLLTDLLFAPFETGHYPCTGLVLSSQTASNIRLVNKELTFSPVENNVQPPIG